MTQTGNTGRRGVSLGDVDLAREKIYRVLSGLYANEVTEESLPVLAVMAPGLKNLAAAAASEKLAEAASLLEKIGSDFEKSDAVARKALITDLAARFATMLVNGREGPGYPAESVHRTKAGLVMQWPRDDVMALYAAESLFKAPGWGGHEDHISVEFEFMADLLEASRKAKRKDARLAALQEEFFFQHLLSWVPAYAEALAAAAKSPFYTALARFTEGFLAIDSMLAVRRPTVKSFPQLPAVRAALAGVANSSHLDAVQPASRMLELRPGVRLAPAAPRAVHSGCAQDCGGQCALTYYVENDRIVRVEAHDLGHPEYRPCARGLMFQYRVYAPDRLKYPLRRVGARGEAKFVRISWDDAMKEIITQLTRVRDAYGPAAIMGIGWSGSTGRLHHATLMRRFLNMAGGHTKIWGGCSYQGGLFGNLATYGTMDSGHYRDDLLNSKIIILWGSDPARSIFGTELRYFLAQCKKKGTPITIVDPRYTNSAAAFASRWIPVRPGTDAAMLAAMAYVIIKKGLQDQKFLDKYTVGFDKFRDYVLGVEDGIPKTPEWAEEITSVPAGTITQLALDYATIKPGALIAGFAPGRSAAGEQFHRAASVLACMTGNVGVSGGGPAGLDHSFRPAQNVNISHDYLSVYADISEMPNAAEEGQPLDSYAICGIRTHTAEKVHPSKAWDAILRGKAGGYVSDIKFLYATNSDCLNQFPDVNKGVEAMKKLDFIVVHDQFMTPTARHADIVLPVTTWAERNDIKVPWQFDHYFVFENKAIEPMYHTKSDLTIFAEMAEKMGIKGFQELPEDDWLRALAAAKGIADYDAFKRAGFYRPDIPKDYVAFAKQIRDPEHSKFPTPSGKIEIFSERIARWGHPEVLPPVPKYVETWEGVADPKRRQYPLQLLTIHPRNRVHSQLYNIKWLRDKEPHVVWMNVQDAAARGINNGDLVKVYNDRGAVAIPAKVTERIMAGVVSIEEGAWYSPDERGIDRGGCGNVLTRLEHSPGGAYASNTSLVQVERMQTNG